MENNVNYFSQVFSYAWQLMQTEITIGGFTFSYADVFIFHFLVACAFHAFWLMLGFAHTFDWIDFM